MCVLKQVALKGRNNPSRTSQQGASSRVPGSLTFTLNSFIGEVTGGLGSLRDDRAFYSWNNNRVSFLQTPVDQYYIPIVVPIPESLNLRHIVARGETQVTMNHTD